MAMQTPSQTWESREASAEVSLRAVCYSAIREVLTDPVPAHDALSKHSPPSGTWPTMVAGSTQVVPRQNEVKHSKPKLQVAPLSSPVVVLV